MDRTYEDLLEEKNELYKALTSTKEVVERFRSDNDSLRRMYEDLKQQFERARKDCNEYQQRFLEAQAAHKEAQNFFEAQMRRLHSDLDFKKREFDELQTRLAPSNDSDMLRLKLVSEIEAPLTAALDAKEQEISLKNDQIFSLSRKLELLQIEFENYRQNTEHDLKDLKESYESERDQHFRQVQQLQERVDFSTEREMIRQLRRENEELSLKVNKLYEELEDTRRTRDTHKKEKTELTLNFKREIDEERNQRRILSIEKDKLEVHKRDLDDTLHKIKLQFEQKQQENINLNRDLSSLRSEYAIADEQVSSYKAEINELNRRLQQKETEFELKVKESIKNETKRYQKEKEEKERYHKEVEELMNKEKTLVSSYNSDLRECRNELDRKKHEVTDLIEDKRTLESKVFSLQKELELIKSTTQAKLQDMDNLKDEHSRLRDKYSLLCKREQELENIKHKLEQNLEKKNEELQIRPDPREAKMLEDKIISLDKQTRFYKSKAREYKQKVRAANDKIHEISNELLKAYYSKHVSSEETDKENTEMRERPYSRAAEIAGPSYSERQRSIQQEIQDVTRQTQQFKSALSFEF
jgi:chromosome segregation ATPase